MLLRSRSFARRLPNREARSVYIFCEGLKREYQYFDYFRAIDSRINIVPYRLTSTQNNSPGGLLEIAKACIIRTKKNPTPKYYFEDGDEVWIVFDTDKDKKNTRTPQINAIKEFCESNMGWHYAQSNPCFEVWLYNHFCFIDPNIRTPNKCKSWKQTLSKLNGGFDSKKHPLLIQDATVVTERSFSETSGTPNLGCTEVFRLANSILPLIKNKLDNELKSVDLF